MANRSILRTAGVARARLAIMLHVLVLSPSGISNVCGQSSVPFEKCKGTVVVPVHINGHGPFRFLLDTGSSACLIDESLAGELVLKSGLEVKMMSATGITEVPAYRIRNLKLGDFEALNVPAASAARNAEVLTSRKAQGVLGLSFLRRFNFLMDYKSRSIVFEPEVRDDSSNDGVYHMACSQGLYIVQLPIGNEAVRFVVDSGADDIVLFSTARIPHARVLSASSVRTPYGEQQVIQAEISGLRIGKRVLNKHKVLIVNGEGPEDCDGLLPANLFSSLYFDNRGNRLVVKPVLADRPGQASIR